MKNHFCNRISDRLFYYTQTDLKELRSRYRRTNEDVPTTLIIKAPRKFLIEKLIEHEFDEDEVQEYRRRCKEWDEMRAFVEYGVEPTPIN